MQWKNGAIMSRVGNVIVCLMMAWSVGGCVSDDSSDDSTATAGATQATGDTDEANGTDATGGSTTGGESGNCDECPTGWSCDDGECVDPDCHIDCFGDMWCEDGVVKQTPTGPAPCELGLEACDEVFEVLTCEHGCAVGEEDDFADPENYCSTAPDAGCEHNGQTYQTGDTFGDCDECSCMEDGQAVCLDIECACNYDGKSYAVGESFPASDGCNECSCTKALEVMCTEKACSIPCDDPALGAALSTLGTWAIKQSCGHSFATATVGDNFRLGVYFSVGGDDPVEGKTWSISFDADGTGLPEQVSGNLEVQTGSKLSVEDCNDAVDLSNQPSVAQKWSPISGSATMSVDKLNGLDFPGGPMTFTGSVSLHGVLIELEGSPGVTCSLPDTSWSNLSLGWWPG